jgi:PAS domain S-box-containing protein
MIETQTLITGLAINVALLLSLTLLYNLFRTYLPKRSSINSGIVYGVLFGGIAVLGMLMRISILPGVNIDGRVVIAGLAGAFGGPITGAAAGLIISGYRLFLGGIGTSAGIGAILTASCIGILVYIKWGTHPRVYHPFSFLGLGIALALQGLLWSVALPADIAWQAFKIYALPVSLFYPLGTVLIGTLLTSEHRHHKTQDALQTSEERLRRVYNTAPLAFVVWDMKTCITDWNKKAEEVFGWPRETVIGRSFFDIIVPDNARLHVVKVVDRLKNGRLTSHSINDNLTKDGRTITCEWNNALLHDNEGNIIGAISIGLDITERLQSQKALRKSEQQVREAFELSRDALYKRDLKTHRYTWISPAVEQITGLPVDQWLRRGGAQLEKIIHPDDLQKTTEHVDYLINLTTADTQEFAIEYRIQKPDKTYSWLLDRHIVLFDSEGNAEFIVGNAQDITRRKEAQKLLENYKHIISSTKDMMALVSRDYRYQAVSTSYAAVFKTTPMELIGKHIEDILGDSILSFSKPLIEQCLAGEDAHGRSWVTDPSGERRFSDASYYPHYEKGTGKVVGYVVSVKDLTEYKQLEDKLLQSYKMEAIGTLAGGIAHDFNNILAAVIGYSDLALTMTENENVRNTLFKVRKAADRATELVKQILTFSRQTDQEVKPLLIKLVVKEALKLIRASIPSSIHIEQSLTSDSYVTADPTQIHQIIMNLCTNASYAMKNDGGTLEVTLDDVQIEEDDIADQPGFSAPGRYVRLSVSDNGTGIPPEILDRIFDPFFTTKPKNEGTGMGLSMIHGIIKSYKGDISVYSRVGKGTAVRVFIPSIKRVGKESLSNDMTPVPTGTERVLFVDDESALVEIGERMLTRLGYQVTGRTSSVDALKLFCEKPHAFDLVITDLTMPNITGDKLAQELLSLRADIPIIMVTGFSEEMKEKEMKRMGITRVILKPIVTRDIAIAIRDVLDKNT